MFPRHLSLKRIKVKFHGVLFLCSSPPCCNSGLKVFQAKLFVHGVKYQNWVCILEHFSKQKIKSAFGTFQIFSMEIYVHNNQFDLGENQKVFEGRQHRLNPASEPSNEAA